MRKLGGLILIGLLGLTACSAPAADSTPTATSTESAAPEAAPVAQKWITKDGQPFDISSVQFKESELGAFAAAAAGIPKYSGLSEKSLVEIGHDLCEHYAGGFTTDDLRAANSEALASLGEAAKKTVCAK
ncbi:hypothetical protein ACIPWF_00820 [Paenarthrobacter sp. NPDC089989]|uniref:hypothetical protein n=1 Tax=unclassified Paenarthrobacter TaxID=2634190 RepID=UPI003823AC02